MGHHGADRMREKQANRLRYGWPRWW